MLTDILRPAPVSSIDEVLSIMTAIDRLLPDSDGLKWFNRLYLRVTQSVRRAVGSTAFHDRGSCRSSTSSSRIFTLLRLQRPR